MGDRERNALSGSYAHTMGHGREAGEGGNMGGGGCGVPSVVDLELLEEIYWAQRKISQVICMGHSWDVVMSCWYNQNYNIKFSIVHVFIFLQLLS